MVVSYFCKHTHRKKLELQKRLQVSMFVVQTFYNILMGTVLACVACLATVNSYPEPASSSAADNHLKNKCGKLLMFCACHIAVVFFV